MSKLIKNLWVFLLGLSVLFASEEWTKNKKAIDKSVEKHRNALIKISDAIWHNAELALEEYKSSKILPNFFRFSAKSIASGLVPIIFTPASFKRLAILRGVCPPN